MKKTKKALVIGPGYLGKPLAISLLEEGHVVHTLSRSDPRIKGSQHISCDIRSAFKLKDPYDLVYYLVSAGEYSERAYQDAYYHGLKHALQAVCEISQQALFMFASSTSLFAENSGGQVQEDSDIAPNSINRAMADGEALLAESELATCVLRFAGIYGPSRDRLALQVASGQARLRLQESISNRIHLVDAVGIMKHLAGLAKPKSMYVVCDSSPSPYNEILKWLHQRLLLKKPLAYELEGAQHRRSSNKFCSNERIRDEGYTFEIPSFKEGFSQIISESKHLKGLYESS